MISVLVPKMWSIFGPVVARGARIVTVPLAIIVGFIGYNLENLVSDKHTPSIRSAIEQREERLLKENLSDVSQETSTLKEKKFVPKSVFDNV